MADPETKDVETKETPPVFTPEQLATPPSCPPLVGGFGPETPEVAEAREAEGLPPPRPFKLPEPGKQSLLMTTRSVHERGAPTPPHQQPASHAEKPSSTQRK